VTSSPKGIAILGSTGSIGRQTVEVVRAHPDLFEVVALVAGTDSEALAAQATELGVKRTGLGRAAALEMATGDDADIVVNAIVGAAGLEASVAALEAGKRLALANKESLVAGGEVCLAAARRGGGQIVAVDSEHAALNQCLAGRDPSEVERIVITASGGPFRKRLDLKNVTPSEALRHPTWEMGPKITVDSATLMNKGLEVIEAHFLFGLGYEQIDTVIHPQSIVHGIVEFIDGSTTMQAGPADMRIPIAAALSHPARLGPPFSSIDPADLGSLTFEPVDHARFPSLGLAFEAGRAGETYPAALNAANEVAVAAFLDGTLGFTGIPDVVQQVLDRHETRDPHDLDSVLGADRDARSAARGAVEAWAGSARAGAAT
jgi:1-deoxy-D-xylulose-5-phosphate reductoisomerase